MKALSRHAQALAADMRLAPGMLGMRGLLRPCIQTFTAELDLECPRSGRLVFLVVIGAHSLFRAVRRQRTALNNV